VAGAQLISISERFDRIEDRLAAHLDALYGLARRLTARPSDAEDLVQETFVRALRAAPRLPDETHLKAWLKSGPPAVHPG